MKSSLGKLRKFALHKSDAKDKIDFLPLAQLDELAQAAQDMQNMRDCYDSLLSAAAATANSAYEFSESLREMGACLLEKTALHDNKESGRVLSMLGQVQLELQKLVDSYRSHIFLTITNPSESLLNELRTVEEMKRQCDEKRNVYEYMIAQHKEKGRSKGGKGESFSSQQMQAAHDEFDEEATLCVFRLKSLKQGQSRSLLTQAARHHAAQLNFFRKGLKSLEAVDPHIKLVTKVQHIDYHFSGLEDDDREDNEGDSENHYDGNEDGELSFDYRRNKQGVDATSTSTNSMEVDQVGVLFPQTSTVENAEVNIDKNQGDSHGWGREPRVVSHSAPIIAEKKFELSEKARQVQPSSRKLNTYVLPTPIDVRGPSSSRTSTSVPRTRPTSHVGHNLWFSTPLEQKKPDKDSGDNNFSGGTVLKVQSVLKESDGDNVSSRLPLPLSGGLSPPKLDMSNASDSKKIKRQAFSGPLTSKPWSSKLVTSANGPIVPADSPQLVSGMPSSAPVHQPSSSPKISPTASPPFVSSPKISELHELPRPPDRFASKPAKPTSLVGHSAPLAFRNQEPPVTNRTPSMAFNAASPLPTPPLVVPRSFSIPSRSHRAAALHVTKLLEPSQVTDKADEIVSPPLTPISMANMKSVSTVPELTSQSGQIKGAS